MTSAQQDPRPDPTTSPSAAPTAGAAGSSATTPRRPPDGCATPTSRRSPATTVEPVYGPDAEAEAADERMGRGSAGRGSTRSPGACTRPATAGATWTIRQFAGFGNAEQTNERYKMILARGGGGLSVAFDMPTLMGRDSDEPLSLGEVGHCGVAIDSAADMETLFADIPLGDVTTSMTISGPGRAGVLHVPRRGRAAGRRPRRPQRHAADRHLQGVHRAEGVAVRARSRTCA